MDAVRRGNKKAFWLTPSACTNEPQPGFWVSQKAHISVQAEDGAQYVTKKEPAQGWHLKWLDREEINPTRRHGLHVAGAETLLMAARM